MVPPTPPAVRKRMPSPLWMTGDSPQRGKQCFLPAPVVNRPADFCFTSLPQHFSPDRLIPLIRRHIETVHNRHPSGQFAMGLDIYVVLAPLAANRRIERNTHRYWVGQ